MNLLPARPGRLALALAALGSAFTVSAPLQAAQISAGGATLPAPVLRTAADCWGNQTELLSRVASGQPLLTALLEDFVYAATGYDCATTQVTTAHTINYVSTGSGRGQIGFATHDTARYLAGATGAPGSFINPAFSLSEAALNARQVETYNQGNFNPGTPGVSDGSFITDPTLGDLSGAFQDGSTKYGIVAPGATPDGSETTTNYANPSELYGPVIQIPALIAPVTIAVDPTYKRKRLPNGGIRGYNFNFVGGALKLSRTTYCDIFNGVITDWNDPAITADNSHTSVFAANDTTTSLPIRIVGRSDSSGTTSLWTRHMARVCGDLQTADPSRTNLYPDSATTLPTAVTSLANSLIRPGNEGVSLELNTLDPGATSGDTVLNGRIGYLSPDYLAKYAPVGSAPAGYGLVAASLENALGEYIVPTPRSAQTAFTSVLPPQSTATGAYDAGADGDRADPTDWVGAPSRLDPLADPSDPGAYPIVGTSNFLLYTCYSTAARQRVLTGPGAAPGFIRWWYRDALMSNRRTGLLADSGFAPVSAAFQKAIEDTFILDRIGRNLNIAVAGQGHCAGKVGG